MRPAAGPVAGLFYGRRLPVIVILKPDPNEDQLQNLISWLRDKNIHVNVSHGVSNLILGLVGDTAGLDTDLISALDIVEDVKRVQEPYKNANRKFHPDDTVIKVGNTEIGGDKLTIMAGPCSVESEQQIVAVAKAVKAAGATLLRGGAFKPRTSPYSFQGLGADGIELLKLAKKETGLPIVTELMDVSQLKYFDDVDIIQVGARNMQNFNLLKVLGGQNKPVMIKRGMSSTYEDWLMSAEYVISEGNENVILCERGIRTFETFTRNTLDISAIPVLRRLTHLPVIVDPSHAAGKSFLVPPLALAAISAGADGLLIEVHNDPEHALCDGPQSLNIETFENLSKQLTGLYGFLRSEKII